MGEAVGAEALHHATAVGGRGRNSQEVELTGGWHSQEVELTGAWHSQEV